MTLSQETHVWRKKYGGIGPSELRRLRQLEEESRKLKQVVVAKKSLRPSRKRELVPELMLRFGASQRQARRVVQMSFSWFRYESVARDAAALKARIKEISETRCTEAVIRNASQ